MENNNSTKCRKCIQCSTPIEGRSDKIFCGINCKNNYHKNQREYRKVNSESVLQILQKNYTILEGVSEGKSEPFEIKKSYLAKLGYAFDYFTSNNSSGHKTCFNFYMDLNDIRKIKIHPPNNRKLHDHIFYDRWKFELNRLMNKNVS